jgi:glycosyltransferase involved in cell wall biosynthesis
VAPRHAPRRSRRAHDVAIYAPYASLFYGRNRAQLGGAELQTTLLALELARRGLRVAHIVYPVLDPHPLEAPAPTLVERPAWQRHRRLGELPETIAIWRAFRRANASSYVVRGGGGFLSAAASFCRASGRRLVFSSSSDLDFDFARPDLHAISLRAYRPSIRLADRVVVQTHQQEKLARQAVPALEPQVIPSFAQPAERTTAEPEYFLWADRLVDYKLPERYLELARALPDCCFRMVGSVTNETPAELLELVRRKADRVPNLELLPPRPRAELLREMDHAAAVVTTSRVEGMPNTFLEAWARGVPVLSLHVDPDGRIAERGVGIAADGSMERFIAGASRLWRDRRLRGEIGERARAFVREVHSLDSVASRWVALLEELVRRPR